MPHTIQLHRVMKCPPERVYRAFTDPKALVKWMAPHGFVAEVHSIDVRPGGSYRMSFTNFNTGQSHTFGGTYSEVKPGEKLRYTDSFEDPNLPGAMAMAIAFRRVEVGGMVLTDLTITQEGVPDAIPAAMCYLGWQESLAMLTALVEPAIP
ncbi:MAG: toxin [Phycisphaerae bacterium]|nr:MAG: toxin [Phycisphaerae bacterium]